MSEGYKMYQITLKERISLPLSLESVSATQDEDQICTDREAGEASEGHLHFRWPYSTACEMVEDH